MKLAYFLWIMAAAYLMAGLVAFWDFIAQSGEVSYDSAWLSVCFGILSVGHTWLSEWVLKQEASEPEY